MFVCVLGGWWAFVVPRGTDGGLMPTSRRTDGTAIEQARHGLPTHPRLLEHGEGVPRRRGRRGRGVGGRGRGGQAAGEAGGPRDVDELCGVYWCGRSVWLATLCLRGCCTSPARSATSRSSSRSVDPPSHPMSESTHQPILPGAHPPPARVPPSWFPPATAAAGAAARVLASRSCLCWSCAVGQLQAVAE